MQPIHNRRETGNFWSKKTVANIAYSYLSKIVNPTFIFEPFVGGGSLVHDFKDDCKGVVNDINKNAIQELKREWESSSWEFHHKDFLNTPIAEIFNEWGLPQRDEIKRFLVYSNPPFGTSSTLNLVSTKEEIEQMKKRKVKSRSTSITYGADERESKYIGDAYGRGDLCLPSIGRMIEVIKFKGKGYLAFFSPFGVLLGRRRYQKLLFQLLKDFEFIYGEVFTGDMFQSVTKKKPISFSIWKYNKGCNTSHTNLLFMYEGKEFQTKYLPLLKEGWRYRDGKLHVEEEEDDKDYLDVFRSGFFNTPYPQIFGQHIKDGSGARVSQVNVKKKLNLEGMSDSLVYGLWSTVVGGRAIVPHPIMFDNCAVHLPDFTKDETKEILAYAVLSTILTELKNNYTSDKIGFKGPRSELKFGGEELTKNTNYLMEKYGHCRVGRSNIKKTIGKLKDKGEINNNTKSHIREEITQRLEGIHYWKYLPILNMIGKRKNLNIEDYI